MLPRRNRTLLALALLAAGCSKPAGAANSSAGGQGGSAAPATTVKVVRPKSDPSLIVSISQPAYVQGFYEADLLARAAGPVKYLVKANGDPVARGELLVEIDVPDRVQDLTLKEAMIGQQLADLKVSEDNVVTAGATVHFAENNVKVERSTLISAEANATYRQSELERYKVLASRQAVTPDVVDEQTNNYKAAVAALASARASVGRAESLHAEAKAKLEAAKADVLLKENNVRVAERNRDYARSLLDLARIYAPFDGVVVRRHADPGTFVKDATTAGGVPLLTVARTDLVTVWTKVPDNYSALLDDATVATVVMDGLPGKLIRSRVSRYSPLIDGKDRTVRVEVD